MVLIGDELGIPGVYLRGVSGKNLPVRKGQVRTVLQGLRVELALLAGQNVGIIELGTVWKLSLGLGEAGQKINWISRGSETVIHG